MRVKRVVDRECLPDLNFVGTTAPEGGAFRRRWLAWQSATWLRSSEPVVFDPLPLLSQLKRC